MPTSIGPSKVVNDSSIDSERQAAEDSIKALHTHLGLVSGEINWPAFRELLLGSTDLRDQEIRSNTPKSEPAEPHTHDSK